MKKEVLRILKEQSKETLFTQGRYEFIRELMKVASKNQPPLREYLSIDPLNKAQFIADHIVKLYG